jgi:hypothetical protein
MTYTVRHVSVAAGALSRSEWVIVAVVTLRRWLLSAWLAMPELILCVAAVLREAGLAVVVEGSHFDVRRRKAHHVLARVEVPAAVAELRCALRCVPGHRGWTG